MEGWKLTLTVSPFSGYSGVYTDDVVEQVEKTIRTILDNSLGFLNAKGERTYELDREDWLA